LDKAERTLDVRWDRQVAERAIDLYAEGWVTQTRLTGNDEKQHLYSEIHTQMKAELERQLCNQSYYVPFGPVRRMILRKVK
jgi:hypothetical protein